MAEANKSMKEFERQVEQGRKDGRIVYPSRLGERIVLQPVNKAIRQGLTMLDCEFDAMTRQIAWRTKPGPLAANPEMLDMWRAIARARDVICQLAACLEHGKRPGGRTRYIADRLNRLAS